MMHWIADWWRGWDETDLASYHRKIENAEPGQAIPVTHRESRASLAELREAYRIKRGWRT